jgi:carbamoylphosphate synthase large subunit
MLFTIPGKRPVVLIGSAGTGNAFGAVMALRRHWSNKVKIVAMDTNPAHLVTASLLADIFEEVPPSVDDKFPPTLVSLIEKYRINTYLPLVDAEILRAAELGECSLLPDGVRVLAPPKDSARICFDKYLAAQWMERKGIASPVTALVSKPFDAKCYFLKPCKGFGSRGARRIEPPELDSIPNSERNDWIVQEVCTGPEVTIDAFSDPERKIMRIACRERLETKSGVCTKARIFFDKDLEKTAKLLSEGLKLEGTFCFQVMKRGLTWVVTDINARPGAGTPISVAVGLDFFGALFARAWGLDGSKALGPLEKERIVTRQYSEFVMV